MLLEMMGRDLGLDQEYLKNLARTASHHYKLYYIHKRNGGKRKIEHPSKELKSVQRWILLNILRRFDIHSACYAYEPGCSIVKHARFHRRSKYILRMDFVDFFLSIRSSDIILHFLKYSRFLPDRVNEYGEWNLEDTKLLCKYVCRNERLTIGAVTSPTISNILCYDLDVELNSLASNFGVVYTRYADDIYFSISEKMCCGL